MTDASQPANARRRYLLKNVALPFACGLGSYTVLLLAFFLSGETLQDGGLFNRGLSWIYVLLLAAGVIIFLIKKRFLCALSVVVSFVGLRMLIPAAPMTFYMHGLKTGVTQKIDLPELEKWVFAQKLENMNPSGSQPFLLSTFDPKKIPEAARQGFENQYPKMIIKEVTGGGREMYFSRSMGILFTQQPPPDEINYLKVIDHVFVFADESD